jgi:hypothetical protein
MMNLLAYADGRGDLLAIAERIGADVLDLVPLVENLLEAGVIEAVESDEAGGGD